MQCVPDVFRCVPGVFPLCRARDGRDAAAELQGAHCHPGPGLPPRPQRQRHGGRRPDRLGEDSSGKTGTTA